MRRNTRVAILRQVVANSESLPALLREVEGSTLRATTCYLVRAFDTYDDDDDDAPSRALSPL